MNTIMLDMSSDDFDAELIQKALDMGYHVELRGFHAPFEDELMSGFKTLDTGTDPFAV